LGTVKTVSQPPDAQKPPIAVAAFLQRVAPFTIFPVMTAAVFTLAAGTLGPASTWTYLALNLANLLVVGPIMIHAGRGAVPKAPAPAENSKWDVTGALFPLTMYIALPLVAGLDVRFGWAVNLGLAGHVLGAAILAAGLGIAAWAIKSNAYMWSPVAIQDGQTVCNIGPYRYVRHPGYMGMILQALAVPILLGSCCALVPGLTAAGILVIATASEDRVLQSELTGYRDYARRVRNFLVPGVW
jgi:protein-S-isoprenylcysteine O-methyltransferase Ste14